jgi:hypothetical protein
MKAPAFLDREHTIAPAGYSRWLVPPSMSYRLTSGTKLIR